MTIKFSEDMVPLTDLKVNPGRVVTHATESHRPGLLTSRGRGVAVVQSVGDYEKAEEERAFMRAVVTGLATWRRGARYPSTKPGRGSVFNSPMPAATIRFAESGIGQRV